MTDWIKPGAVVIDVGVNFIDPDQEKSILPVSDLTPPRSQIMVGDVDYASVRLKASWITPVPGGISKMNMKV